MAKIIDCFIFYNELDLLTYRLNILNDVVDYFIIVESTNTFVGRPKPLFYHQNKHLFEQFNDKIINIIVDDFPYKNPMTHDDIWNNEHHQRNAIARGINELINLNKLNDEDYIIITDLDEIPDPVTLTKILKGEIIVDGANVLEVDMYYYNLNTKFKIGWGFPKIITYKKYKEVNTTCQKIRTTFYPDILRAGWHLSYFGDKYHIQNKIQNFSHQELNIPEYTNVENIEYRINNGLDLYNRTSTDNPMNYIKIEDNDFLPPQYDKYLTKYYT